MSRENLQSLVTVGDADFLFWLLAVGFFHEIIKGQYTPTVWGGVRGGAYGNLTIETILTILIT